MRPSPLELAGLAISLGSGGLFACGAFSSEAKLESTQDAGIEAVADGASAVPSAKPDGCAKGAFCDDFEGTLDGWTRQPSSGGGGNIFIAAENPIRGSHSLGVHVDAGSDGRRAAYSRGVPATTGSVGFSLRVDVPTSAFVTVAVIDTESTSAALALEGTKLQVWEYRWADKAEKSYDVGTLKVGEAVRVSLSVNFGLAAQLADEPRVSHERMLFSGDAKTVSVGATYADEGEAFQLTIDDVVISP